MNEAEKILHAHGIKPHTHRPGQHYTTCPQCSAQRSKKHQKSKVLGVLIESGDNVVWHCNHCGWSGPPKGSGGGARPELLSYIYRDVGGVVRFRKVRNRPGKEPPFWLEQPDGRGGWKNGTKGVDTKIIYRVDEVAKAIKAGREIAVVEGEKDADRLWERDIPATCNAHGASEPGKQPKWTARHSEQLRGADIVVFNDDDAPGYAHADTTCKLSQAVAARVRRLDLKNHWPEIPNGGDVSDWLAVGGDHTAERLRELIANAPVYVPESEQSKPKPEPEPRKPEGDDADIERLAKLSGFEYEHARAAAAKALRVRARMLDKLVAVKRAELGLDDDDDNGKQGRPLVFPEPEPASEPVDGAALLDALTKAIGSYVIMSDASRDAMALWIVHTYLVERFMISPRLAIRSPTHRCGKTTLIDVVSPLVRKPLSSDNITAPALTRVVAAHRPTVLIDEADSFARGDDALIGIIKGGHRRNRQAIRLVGDDYEPRAFDLFGALAIALIGNLPAPLIDRSVVVDLKRRTAAETVTEFRFDRTEALDELARKIARWAQDNVDVVGAADPAMPSGVINRAADNWRPLLAIADAAGGQWPDRARMACVAGNPDGGDDLIETLIGDIAAIFDDLGRDRISSAQLIEKLCDIPGRPWAEFGKSGKPITQNKLARLLKPLRQPGDDAITPQLIRLPDSDDPVRGYQRSQFDDVFERYLPEREVSNRYTATNADEMGTSGSFQTVTGNDDVTVRTSHKPCNDGLCDGVTVRKGENGTKAASGLSQHTIGWLADWYSDSYYSRREEIDIERALHDDLRHRLTAEHGVLPEFVDIELRRVMDQVFKMSSGAEDALTKDRAPSGGEGTFRAEVDLEPAGSGGLNGIAHAPFCSPQPEDDLSIPKFLRRTQ
jgi:hypothetical protein